MGRRIAVGNSLLRVLLSSLSLARACQQDVSTVTGEKEEKLPKDTGQDSFRASYKMLPLDLLKNDRDVLH